MKYSNMKNVAENIVMPEDMKTIIDACDRSKAGPTAPAHGLTMIGLEYE